MLRAAAIRKSIDRARFALVCLYLTSQVYLLPVLTRGVSWAVWPTIADLVTLGMIPICVIDFGNGRMPSRHRMLFIAGWIAVFGCLFSYVTFTLFDVGVAATKSSGKAPSFGAFTIVRIIQALIVFHTASRVVLTDSRKQVLKRMAVVSSVAIATGVLLTFSGVVSLSTAAPQLPTNIGVAGPWGFYSNGTLDTGVGFIGYNHGYAAVQLLLAAGLALQLVPRGPIHYSIALVTLMATFCTGSRAGFACAALFVVALEKGRAGFMVVLLAVVLACTASIVVYGPDLGTGTGFAARQASAANSLEADGLSGRTDIWQNHTDLLNKEYLRWVSGMGFGRASDFGNNAHMLFLQIVFETGVFGLLFFIGAWYKILCMCWSSGLKSIFWMTSALLVGCFTRRPFIQLQLSLMRWRSSSS